MSCKNDNDNTTHINTNYDFSLFCFLPYIKEFEEQDEGQNERAKECILIQLSNIYYIYGTSLPFDIKPGIHQYTRKKNSIEVRLASKQNENDEIECSRNSMSAKYSTVSQRNCLRANI